MIERTGEKEGVDGPPAWYRRAWLWGSILILFVILAYTPVWQAGFIWDDDAMLTANPCVVGPLGLKEIWTTGAADICPLTITTLWIEHALWALTPLFYHLVNVLLHGACAIVLWRVLLSLHVPGAWLGAALWALHPVQVESVAWITEMKNTESGLFFLLSILFFVKCLARISHASVRNASGWDYALSLLFAALAMASKSSTVILPVVLCLCAWWIEGRWNWRNLVRVLPTVPMSVAAGALSILTQGLQLARVANTPLVRSWPERLATAGYAIWFYLGKLLWPYPLVAIYPHWEIDFMQRSSYLPLLAVITVLTVLWLKREPWSRACFFAFAYFIVALLPALGLIDNYVFHSSLVFDHFQYLASMGPLALAGAGLTWASDIVFRNRPTPILRHADTPIRLFPAVLLLGLGIVSWERTWVFKDHETLWTDTLAKNPNSWVGHNNLGLLCLKREQVEEALQHFHKAVEVNPNSFLCRANLGNALFKSGELDDAVLQYQRAVEINPTYFAIHYNLGVALSRKGRLDEAISQFQETLRLKPDFGPAKVNLAKVLREKDGDQ
jgi:tetratricopeptide (TPR) repeat protein